MVTETMTTKSQKTENHKIKRKKRFFQFCGKKFKSNSYHQEQLLKLPNQFFKYVPRKNSKYFLMTGGAYLKLEKTRTMHSWQIK